MTTACDCPICPLTDANVQCCDVYVKLYETNYKLMNINPDYRSLHADFALLAISAQHGSNVIPQVKIGKSVTITRSDFTLSIERESNSLFKICFHTKRVTESDTDLD